MKKKQTFLWLGKEKPTQRKIGISLYWYNIGILIENSMNEELYRHFLRVDWKIDAVLNGTMKKINSAIKGKFILYKLIKKTKIRNAVLNLVNSRPSSAQVGALLFIAEVHSKEAGH